ncbi:MAG: nitroreductase family protein [Thermotaleaceae bacterium]
MKETMLYETIFKRKSIRKYDLTPMNEDVLNEISNHIQNLKPMYENIKTEISVVAHKDIKGLMAIKAPHYIVAYSEVKEGYLPNIGFMLQQIDLYLSAKGVGSCWLGLAKPAKEILAKSQLEFVITLAIGRAMEPLHREGVSEFKRKTLTEITDIKDRGELLEAARLAPSATNSQPWFFKGGEGLIHGYCIKHNLVKAMIYERLNKVDMGIAFCHLWLAAKNQGRAVVFIADETAREDRPKGYDYTATASIE